MSSTYKRIGIFLLLGVLSYNGFVWGRELGSQTKRPRLPGLPTLQRMLSANANGAMGEGDFGGHGDTQVPPQAIFEDVLDKVQREFVDFTGDTSRLSNGALSRLFSSLDDPRTYYLEPKLRRARQEALMGRYQGIGAVLTITKSKKEDVEYRHLSVVAVMPSSPAEKAGLKTGDRLTEIDGRWIIAYSVSADIDKLRSQKELDAVQRNDAAKRIVDKFQKGLAVTKAMNLLMVGEGRPTRLTVQRTGQAQPLTMELTTAVTEVKPVEYRALNAQVGYLRIAQFNRKAAHAFEEALDNLDAHVKGLVVDLRSNPGGVLSETIQDVDGLEPVRSLLARLTPGGKVAMLERKPTQKLPFTVPSQEGHLSMPLVVLVDHGTAGLSELTASALREAGKAKIVGSRTFGDGILPLFSVFKNGSGVEMSTAHLFTASGNDIAQGITPDVAVADEAGADAVLRRALALFGA